MFKTKLVSSMEKGFWDSDIATFPTYERCTAMRDMQTSFQLFAVDTDLGGIYQRYMDIELSGDLVPFAQFRTVESVPSLMPAFPGRTDDNYLRTEPGLYPDVLQPVHYRGKLPIVGGVLRSIWFDVTVPADAAIEAGEHTLTVKLLLNDEVQGEHTFTVDLVDSVLPRNDFRVAEWFHCDCLASYYNVPIFSERHWEIIENFARVSVKNGNSMLLTPVFTLALDTYIGGERPTAQLVEVTKENGKYSFNYDKFDRWIEMCNRVGVQYIEISHLYTQWGAAHAPKVMATVDGEYRRIFGWDTDAHGEEYVGFLDAFLPDLLIHLKALGIDKRCYFHISDEPNRTHIENYTRAKEVLGRHLAGYPIMDALSSITYFEKGLVKTPIVATNHIEKFLVRDDVEDLWVYYCCEQCQGVSNRMLSMPGWRTRYIGVQMYYYNIKGFLQWGFNYYYNRWSYDLINPYMESTGENFVPSGDAYSVYPAADGTALESIRLLHFREGLEDMQLCRMAEQKCGREAVIAVIEQFFGKVVFSDCARSAKPILELRAKLLAMLAE